MFSRKIKIVILTNNDLFFGAVQKEFVYDNVELVYLQSIDNVSSFVKRLNPDIVIINWINDEGLENIVLNYLSELGEIKPYNIIIFPEEELTYKKLSDFELNKVMLYFSPISLKALISNIKNEIEIVTKSIIEEKNRYFLENILRIIYHFNKKDSVEEVFNSIMVQLPKFLPFDFFSIGLFSRENRQLEFFSQFENPGNPSFLIANKQFEKHIIKWSSYQSFLKFTKSGHKEEMALFEKWGWNVEEVLIFPIKNGYEPIGFLLFGSKSTKIQINQDMIKALEFINQFLIQKLMILQKEKKSSSYTMSFLKEVILSEPNEDNFFKVLCATYNKIANTDITLFWQHKKGFHILFPKFHVGIADEEMISTLQRSVVYLDKNKVFSELLKHRKWKVYEYLDNNNLPEELKPFKAAGAHHILMIPLVIDDEEIGVFTSISTEKEKPISPWSLNELNELSQYLSKLYRLVEIVKEADTKFKQLNKIFELGNQLKLHINIEEILKQIIQAIRKTLGWNDIAIYLFDENQSHLMPKEYVGFHENVKSNFNVKEKIEKIKLDVLFEECTKIGNCYFYKANGNSDEVPESAEWQVEDEVIVPIETPRKIHGYMVLKDPIERMRPEIDKLQPLEYFANQLAVAIENSLFYEALKSSEERYRSLAETMPLALVSCDEKGKIIYYNPMFKTMAGLPDEKLIGTSISQLFVEKNQPAIKKFIREMNVKQSQNSIFDELSHGVEMEMKSSSVDETIPVAGFFSKIENALKEKFFIVFNDIREQKKLEKMRENFNSMIVHDLRSPLNVIQGFMEILLKETPGPINDQQEEFLNISMENVKKVLHLVDNFLVMSRMKAGRFSITPQLGDLNNTIRKIVKQNSVIIKKKQLKIEVSLNEHLPMMLFDAFRIEQVLNNLINNAIKYSEEKGIIFVQTKLHKETIGSEKVLFALVSVKDEGVGIPEEERENIFNIYEFGQKDNFQKEGTGLGLAICKEIVETHGGKIWVESEIKKGSTFYFTIPIPSNKELLSK